MGNSLSAEEVNKIINKAKSSKLVILDVYHDRCESCKDIEPIMEKLKEENAENQNISFLKYDLSNPVTVFNSRKIAKELNLEDIYKAQRYSGVVLFIDREKKKVLHTLIGEYDIEKYNELIKDTLKGNA